MFFKDTLATTEDDLISVTIYGHVTPEFAHVLALSWLDDELIAFDFDIIKQPPLAEFKSYDAAEYKSSVEEFNQAVQVVQNVIGSLATCPESQT